jgi:hypothetical protein
MNKYERLLELHRQQKNLLKEIQEESEADYQERLALCRTPEWREDYVKNHWLNQT